MPLGDPVLDLSYRKFKRLPSRVWELTYLEKLYACGNRLRTVPDSISQLQGLRMLALDFNKLEDVPLAVCELTNLTHLYLGSNRLMILPPEFTNLKSLRCFWMESNYFQTFPRELYELPNLKSLQMGDNRLKTLPRDFCRMESLKGLWLYGNRFETFPKVLLGMESLEILDLDRNKITEFPSLKRLRPLHLFSYDHNPVKEPPKVGQEVILVGEGAAEFMEVREARKERRRKAAEEEAEDLQISPCGNLMASVGSYPTSQPTGPKGSVANISSDVCHLCSDWLDVVMRRSMFFLGAPTKIFLTLEDCLHFCIQTRNKMNVFYCSLM
uniref:Leucine rich repeat containing 10B n=1 Tax=Fundulus heteroclitus TaxID=8078 RepID=A0A3Q2QAC4_FUNHE